MSSVWGYTKIVLEGESAKNVYALLQCAKDECAKEENGYISEMISVADVEYRFVHGLKFEYRKSPEDNEFSPPVIIGKHPVMDYFALYPCPIDDDDRTWIQYGNIKYEYDGAILRICESTYASKGTMLPFLIALLGEECSELYYWINCEADYIGETNDINHKHFNPEAEWDLICSTIN